MGWSMDRQGIRTLFDHESKRLKQVKLSGPRRERVRVLRYFLATLRNEVVEFPNPGDETAKFSYLTRHTSLGKLIRTFNEALAEAEKKFEVDIGVVHIRDAIAHGRLVTTEELPFRLWKFGANRNGRVGIEFSEELTPDWLKNTSE